MENKEFGRCLEKRTKQFAIRIIMLCEQLPETSAGKVIRYQLIKSGTWVGANYREANRAVSRADFINKISICAKETSETQYWLEVAQDAGLLDEKTTSNDYKECSELLALFTTIKYSSKRPSKQNHA